MVVGALRKSMGGGLRIQMTNIILILMANIPFKIYARISNKFFNRIKIFIGQMLVMFFRKYSYFIIHFKFLA